MAFSKCCGGVYLKNKGKMFQKKDGQTKRFVCPSFFKSNPMRPRCETRKTALKSLHTPQPEHLPSAAKPSCLCAASEGRCIPQEKRKPVKAKILRHCFDKLRKSPPSKALMSCASRRSPGIAARSSCKTRRGCPYHGRSATRQAAATAIKAAQCVPLSATVFSNH